MVAAPTGDDASRTFVPTLRAVESAARERMSPEAWDYLAHGAGDEVTLRANVEAWQRLRLRPRALRDMSDVRTGTAVLGCDVAAPILVAPTAMHRFFHDEGERATARAAARFGTVYVVSMAATTSLEDVAAEAPAGTRWAQMYMLRDRGRTRALAERARAVGCTAIVASVDGAAVAQRTRRSGGTLVPPAWFRFPNLAPPDDPDRSDVMAMVSDVDPSVRFEDLSAFREWSELPVVVKGVMRGDDALRCLEAGASAVAVSNHGGRTLDGVAATAEVLPEVVEAVDGRGEVYVDGGIRSGADVLRAVCLGARAVMVGRPVLWGLAVGGEQGVVDVLTQLADELQRAMALCGRDRVERCGPDVLRTRS